MAKKFKTSTSTAAKASKDPTQVPILRNKWHLDNLRSRIKNQSEHFTNAFPQLKPRRSDTAHVTKRKESTSEHYLKSFRSDPTAGTLKPQKRSHSQMHNQQKNTKTAQKKKVAIKKKPQQPKSKSKLPPKEKEANGSNGASGSNGGTGKVKAKSNTTQKKIPKQQPKQGTKQSQQQHQKQKAFELQKTPFGEQQKLGVQKNIGFVSYLNSKKPPDLNLGLNSNGEKQEFDFDGFFWKVAERRLEANRMLLLEARADLAALRSENQKLRSVLLSTKREGEKYKRQLENEVFRKLINNDM